MPLVVSTKYHNYLAESDGVHAKRQVFHSRPTVNVSTLVSNMLYIPIPDAGSLLVGDVRNQSRVLVPLPLDAVEYTVLTGGCEEKKAFAKLCRI